MQRKNRASLFVKADSRSTSPVNPEAFAGVGVRGVVQKADQGFKGGRRAESLA